MNTKLFEIWLKSVVINSKKKLFQRIGGKKFKENYRRKNDKKLLN